MKRKYLLAAGLLAATLAAGSVVYALSAPSPAKQIAAPTAQAVAPTPTKKPVLRPYARPGSKAESILNEVLEKKEMTATDCAIYENTPESVKEMTYEEARARADALYEKLWGGGVPQYELFSPEMEERYALMEEYDNYYWYANAIAVETELAKVQFVEFKVTIESIEPNARKFHDPVSEMNIHFFETRIAMSAFLLPVLADVEKEINSPNCDYVYCLETMELVRAHIRKSAAGYGAAVSVPLYEKFTSQYKEGVPLAEILEGYTAPEIIS